MVSFFHVGLTFKGQVEYPRGLGIMHSFIRSFIHQTVKYFHVLGAKDSKRTKTHQGT